MFDRSDDEGNVVKILERGYTKVVGVFRRDRKSGYLIPDDKKLATEIYIPLNSCFNVKNGVKAVAKITSYPQGKAPGGEIVEILGDEDDFFAEELSIIRAYDLREEFPPRVEKEASRVCECYHLPISVFFMVPSCVPATEFDESAFTLDSNDVLECFKLDNDRILGLAEMMNYPGVLFDDNEVAKKIESAKHHNKPIDGHAPLLSGNDLKKYCSAGISTDHECSDIEEAREKASLGMTILIREGSAANNLNALIPLIREYPNQITFCTDDAHPHELVKSHINGLVKKTIDLGYNVLDVIKAATLNPVKHYNLEVGLLQKNDPADFIVIDNFNNFNILRTYIDGELVAENAKSLLPNVQVHTINNFVAEKVTADDFKVIDEDKDGKFRLTDIKELLHPWANDYHKKEALNIILFDKNEESFFKGNQSNEWVSLENISEELINSTIYTEDKK